MEYQEELLRRIDLLIRIGAANLVVNKKFNEQVAILSSLGMAPKEIAQCLGKDSNNVRVTLSSLRKGGKLRS